jgi:hypothetical protein
MSSQPTCICCQQPLRVDDQPALIPGRKPTQLFTCVNPQCGMYFYTFDSRSYATLDIEKYLGGKR